MDLKEIVERTAWENIENVTVEFLPPHILPFYEGAGKFGIFNEYKLLLITSETHAHECGIIFGNKIPQPVEIRVAINFGERIVPGLIIGTHLPFSTGIAVKKEPYLLIRLDL